MRSLLQGSEKFIDNILKMCDEDPSLLLGGVSHDDDDCVYVYDTCMYIPMQGHASVLYFYSMTFTQTRVALSYYWLPLVGICV